MNEDQLGCGPYGKIHPAIVASVSSISRGGVSIKVGPTSSTALPRTPSTQAGSPFTNAPSRPLPETSPTTAPAPSSHVNKNSRPSVPGSTGVARLPARYMTSRSDRALLYNMTSSMMPWKKRSVFCELLPIHKFSVSMFICPVASVVASNTPSI